MSQTTTKNGQKALNTRRKRKQNGKLPKTFKSQQRRQKATNHAQKRQQTHTSDKKRAKRPKPNKRRSAKPSKAITSDQKRPQKCGGLGVASLRAPY